MRAPDGGVGPAVPAADLVLVTGGSHGFAATYGEVLALAERFQDAALDLGRSAVADAALAADPDLVASAVLAPTSFARAERAILAATTGPEGLAAAATTWAVDALRIRTSLAMIEHADETAAAALAAVRATASLTVAAAGLPHQAGALVDLLNPLDDSDTVSWEEWIGDHPDVLGGMGLLGTLVGAIDASGPVDIVLDTDLQATTPAAVAGLAAVIAMLPDGDAQPVVTPLDGLTDLPVQQPESLVDLVEQLGAIGDLSPEADSPLNGTIAVQTVPTADGVQYIVYLPGTDDMLSLPGLDDDVRDNTTNVQLLGGAANHYVTGVLDAMGQAGIGPDDEVLLVGHSQGGMAAVAIAGAEGGPYVTDVVTLGSPTAHVDGFPEGTNVLSLEEEGDVIPLLDGADNVDSAQQVTVVFESPTATGLEGHHGTDTYAQGAQAVVDAAEQHPSVADSLESLSDFLGVGQADSQVYQITRPRRIQAV